MTKASIQCENCGAWVSSDYGRVFSPEDDPDSVRVCPHCPDMIREGRDVREARSPRR